MTFSIIIPTFNRKILLLSCLKSLNYQIFKDFEVIICDDGSSDGSKEFILNNTFSFKIQYIYSENTGGPASPRNQGIKAANGKWIAFLDSDDMWYPNKLEECAKYLDKSDFIFHNLHLIDRNNNIKDIFKSRPLRSKNREIDMLINFNPIATSSVVIKKDIFGDVGFFSEKPELRFIEDFDLWLRIAKQPYQMFYLNKTLGSYLVHGQNSSSDLIKQTIKLKKLYLSYTQNSLNSKKIIGSFSYLAACNLIKSKRYKLARFYLINCIKKGEIKLKLKSFIKLILN